MRLDKLLERLEYEVVQGSDQTEVTTLVNDSRKVEKGSVFVCISGAVSDGHRFAPDVAEKGAAALVVEKEIDVPADVTVIRVPDTRYALALMSAAYFGYPAEKLKIIGITGTKGKTTTTYMIRSILEGVGHKVGLIGTIEAIIGDRKIPAANTTPESFTIHQYFAEMVKILTTISGAKDFCSNSAGWGSRTWTTNILRMSSKVPPAGSRPSGSQRKRTSGRRMSGWCPDRATWALPTMWRG